MILRRTGLNPLCRQCGYELQKPAARCPMCGARTGLVEPLRAPSRTSNDARPLDQALEQTAVVDIDEEAEDIVVGPPVERLPAEPIPAPYYPDHYEETETPKAAAPVARSISLRSLMLGTLLIAVCLGLGRVSPLSGIVSFLIIVPAYIRTLSAIWYYRQAHRELGREDIAAIFATSLVLALMGLAGGGLVFLATSFLAGLIVQATGGGDPVIATTVVGVTAAFVTVLVLVHMVWPVNED